MRHAVTLLALGHNTLHYCTMADDAPSIPSTTTAEHTNEHNHEQLIPNEILAHLKDHRYIHNLISICRELNMRPVTATLLYYLLVFMKSRRTLGMEHAGVEYYHISGSIASRLRLIAKIVLQVVLPIYLLRHDDGQSEEGNSSTSTEGNRDSNAANSNERLHGAARRSAFFEQRRRMLERAAAVSSTNEDIVPPEIVSHGNASDAPPSNIVAANGSNRMQLRQEKINLRAIWNHLCIRIAWIQRTSTRVASNHHLQSTLQWILKMHLAAYFINGKFNSLSSRLLGINVRDREPALMTSSSSQKPSYRMIGYLIALEAFAGTFFMTSDASIKFVLLVRRYIHKTIAVICSKPSSSADEESEINPILSAVEKKVPSIRCERSQHVTRTSGAKVCNICMNVRTEPSVAPCGHVFCWKCIIHWTTSIQPECPLCRSPCRGQDIVVLHKY